MWKNIDSTNYKQYKHNINLSQESKTYFKMISKEKSHLMPLPTTTTIVTCYLNSWIDAYIFLFCFELLFISFLLLSHNRIWWLLFGIIKYSLTYNIVFHGYIVYFTHIYYINQLSFMTCPSYCFFYYSFLIFRDYDL